MSMPVGYIAATNPSLSTTGIRWWSAGSNVYIILQFIAVPGTDQLAVQLEDGSWVLCQAQSGTGPAGQTIAPDPAFSVAGYVWVAGARMFFSLDKTDIPSFAASQMITYSPNSTPQWTAKKVR